MQSARDILSSLAADSARFLPRDLAAALAWQAAAGPDLSARARATGMRGGVLWLQCDDAATRALILSIEPELLRALRPHCHRLRFQP